MKMKKPFVIYFRIILLTLGLSFCTDEKSNQKTDTTNNSQANTNHFKNLSFNFSVISDPKAIWGKEVNAYIYTTLAPTQFIF
jgi:hypothetical protein